MDFLSHIASIPGIDAEAFASAMREPPAVSVKLNRRKCVDPEKLGYGALDPVAWCRSGYYLDERPKFTLNPLLHAGAFYVQDASSMIHESIVSTILRRFGLPESPLVLDLCAAPGGKTTSMINALPDDAVVVANEVVPRRAAILRENILKWGFRGSVVTGSRTSDIASLGETFDLIAVDAPCSGEGMMRKDPDAVAQWGPGLIRQCAALQREILTDACAALNPGGFLIYSTCTFNRDENEDNLAWAVENLGLEVIDMEMPAEWGIGASLEPSLPALRFMPHLTRGEGLFAALLRKPGAIPGAQRRKQLERIRKKLRILADIPAMLEDAATPAARPKASQRKEKEPRPDAALPLCTSCPADAWPRAELSLDDALSYLRHEAVRLAPDVPKGFVVVTFSGFPLGFVKNIGNRANNLYPAEWRIRNL